MQADLVEVAYVFLVGSLFLAAGPVYRWNCAARWARMPWYRPPAPGSVREWLERPRPRLHRFGAGAVTAYALLAGCYFLVAIFGVLRHL